MATQRIWEIDFARGVAVVLMIWYHLFWSLNYFGLIQVKEGILIDILARSIPFLFFIIIGISLVLTSKKGRGYVYYLKRGLMIFGYGLIVALLVFIFLREPVMFGVLNFIGVGIIIAPLFLNLKKLNLILGVLFIIVGIIIMPLKISFKGLFWLGLTYRGFHSLDYFPIFPWLGVILLGISAGNYFYATGCSVIRKPQVRGIDLVEFMGRHALLIYFAHNILILGVLFLITGG